MQQFTTFVIHHWELWLAFIVLLAAFLILELRNKFTGFAQLGPQEATLLMNREDILLLDLRDNANFVKGHIVNAVNIPLTAINEKADTLEKYKGRPVLMVCAMGQQPKKAGMLLAERGFDRIYILQGGMQAWQNAGLPQVKGK